ncbi:MAG TPA: OmpA family protein [Terriglobales bacterium]|nr:OmpA family protein [Terriglobales bacterium]
MLNLPIPEAGGPGVLPPVFKFRAGGSKLLTFSHLEGKVSCCGPGGPFNGPEGGSAFSTDIVSFQGIAGVAHHKKSMFLVGVFLDDTEPTDPAPERLDFTENDGFAVLSPQLRQVFLIGDGMTGPKPGQARQFVVPEKATRLFLGFADASGFGGKPGYYDDNVGKVTAAFQIRKGKPAALFSVKEEAGKIGITVNDAVLFDFNKSDLKPAAEAVLQQIKSTVIDQHPGSKLMVEGYTDNVGGDAYNLQLSNKRAQSVADWLQHHGVESSRLQTQGYGKEKPRFPNTSESNRAKNRRVEINVIK